VEKAVLKIKLIDVFKMEENVVSIYLEKLFYILTRYLNKKDLKEVEEIIQVLIRNSNHHRNTCQNVLSQLDLDQKNDY
jgi:hypothetical protein